MASKDISASCFVSVSRDLTDSVRKLIDKSAIKFVRGVKFETKNGKAEDRILVLTTWRLYLMAAKVPTKVEATFNFLEIRAMNTQSEVQVVIETDKATYSLRLQTRDHLDHVINHINFSLSRIFNNSVFAPSLCHSDSELSDGSKKYSPSSDTSVETQRACGGFSETYAALCDYNGISCKEEVQWDVDTIYHSQDNREFNLLDFSHLESRDLAVIVASMAYNTWFTKLYCKDLRIGSEVTEQVLHTLSKSSSLEEITLENTGLKSDFPQKLSVALSDNPASVIHSLNLAHNTLDNQGVCNLIQQVCRLSKGLRVLNLSKTSLSSKGVVSLSQALCSNDDYSNSLLHLDLSKNPGILSGEDATHLHMFLSQPNCLVHLDLSATDCCVGSLFGALLRGCCADLSYLNLSKNSFSHRKVKESLPLFRQFFNSAFSLMHVSLASTKLPPDALRNLFLGLTNNPHINDMHLDISGCELRSAGAAVIQELFPRVTSIATLDISDNGFDADLLSVLPALSRHPSLKHLHLGKNFNVKSRLLDDVLQKLVQLIQEEECVLQSLSLVDSRLRSRGTVLVNALGSNACLRKVDLSGNGLDDIGAKMLSKALQINTTLRSVTWDRNSTTATGLMDVARALEHNFTLQYMPIPLSDVTQAYRIAPEKTEQALTKIQRALLRNNQTQRFSQRQALRLHQGLVTSTAEQVMERLCVRVQQQVCVLRGVAEVEDLQAAKQVLKEARNSRALYPSLCELAHVLSVDGPVRQRLDSLAGELAKAADKELQVIVESMVSLCRELCPLSSAAAEQLSPPISSVSERVSIPRSSIRTALMERAAQDIHRALEEVKLSVVSYLTNSIVDQILQELYSTHKALTQQVSQLKQWDGVCDGGTGRRSHRHRDSLEITDEELGTSIDTIAIKKRSSRTRRIRPVSTRLSLCDDSSSSPPTSAAQLSSPLSRSASWEGLSALPTQGAPLHHVTRVRPKPPRRHKGALLSSDSHCTENGAVTPLDDGLPDFYSKRVLPDSQLSSLHKAHSLRRKKSRNVLAIFGFRRNRSATLSNQEPDSLGVACSEDCWTVATAPTGNALENVYTLLQPPRLPGRGNCPAEVTDGTVEDQRMEEPRVGVMELRSVQGMALTTFKGNKYPFYTSKMKSEVETDHEPHSVTDKNSEREINRQTLWLAERQTSREVDRQRLIDRELDRQMSRQSERATESEADRHTLRHPDREVDKQIPKQTEKLSEREVDRQTLRKIDRELDRQTARQLPEREVDRHTLRQIDRELDRQMLWKPERHSERELDRHTLRQIDRQAEAQQRQASRQWADYRQTNRGLERQWSELKQTDTQWTDLRQVDRQSERQWIDRQAEKHASRQTHCQWSPTDRPLPPYPAGDRTPSPSTQDERQMFADAEQQLNCDAQANKPVITDPRSERDRSREEAVERPPPFDTRAEQQANQRMDQRAESWQSEERCRGTGATMAPIGRSMHCLSKPNPPPQSSKPSLAKLRQRPLQESSGTEDESGAERDSGRVEKKDREGGMERARETEGQPPPIPAKPKTAPYVLSPTESANERKVPPFVPTSSTKPPLGLAERSHTQGEESMRPQAPLKPQRNRKALSCDTGPDRDSPHNLEKPPNPRNPPVKKPRLPQNRNQSLEHPDCVGLLPGNSEPL
ncbi:capping protein, Arp2/3 and myosin-I linker protein 3-like isoform X1 [Electrophorus electricus]|uniref:capping protein, Arp2/3 and myosin-I linker protein 3-like isoform X1 n=2 Tax=Electrophorus electricus TaxID=8005 RepID=UPI0015D03736|nr:capping protein, Arp2/3 and myosin-I linker protein 3-like isoform X1 [Electrophorus electricus]